MKDMISQIVEMDKKARELTEEVQRNKISAEQEIVKIREKIRDEYITKARKRLSLNEKTERKNANKTLKEIQKKQQDILKSIDVVYEQKCDEWVDLIVKNVKGE